LENVTSMSEEDKDEITKKLKQFGNVHCIPINSDSFSAQSRKRLYWTNIPVEKLEKQLKTDPYKHSMRVRDILDTVSNARKYIIDHKNSQVWKSYNKNKEKYGSYIGMQLVDLNDDLNKPAPTVRRTSNMWIKDTRLGPNVYRKLTPLELERLQTFPDHWTNVDGLSYSRRVKAIGNAVTCNVIEAIVDGLKK